MDATDPRHGTQRGRSQHHRDGEEPCDACREGDALAGRRRRKRRTMGHAYTKEVGVELHQRLTELRDQGATYQQIADWAGVGFRTAWGVINSPPTLRIYAETHDRLSTFRPPSVVTVTGLTRRVRALQALGYSLPRIATEMGGVSMPRMLAIRDGDLTAPSHSVRERLVEAYDRLHMTPAPASTVGERKGATRARNTALRNGWHPPLAWDRIDDPDEQPKTNLRGPADPTVRQQQIDMAVVLRLVDEGKRVRQLTAAEARLACSVLRGRGLSSTTIEQQYRLKAERYDRGAA